VVLTGSLKSTCAVQRLRGILELLASSLLAVLRRHLFCAFLMLAASVCAAAQAGAGDVHLVLVNVGVLDHAGRAVPELKAEQFTVLDEQDPQVVTYFSDVDEPISLVVVVDATASMAARIDEARKALTELINTSNPQDELGLVVIHDEPGIAAHLGGSRNEIERIAGTIQADGFGAMWDGMYLGIKELQNSRCRRKAMVVISDGGDKNSRHTPSELKSLLKEADVQVYAAGRFDRYANRFQARMRALQLEEVISVTGGRVLPENDLSRAVTQMSYELRHQYVLGYCPGNRNRDGQWRKLKVRLSGSDCGAKLRLYAKKGYYAPAG